VHSLNVPVLRFVFDMMMVQWAETCRRIFNIDYQYVFCFLTEQITILLLNTTGCLLSKFQSPASRLLWFSLSMGQNITCIFTCNYHFVAMLHFERDIFPEFWGLNAVKRDKNNTLSYAVSRIWKGCYIGIAVSALQLVGKEFANVTFPILKPTENLPQLTKNTSCTWWRDGLQTTSDVNWIRLARDYDQ